MEEERKPSSPYAEMPQSVRQERAKLLIAQAATGAAVSYGLTLIETAAAVEGVLSDLRGNVLALVASQYQEAAVPQPPMAEVPKADRKTA